MNNVLSKGDSIVSRDYTEAMWRVPTYGGENKMSLDVYIAPDSQGEEEVQEWIEDDEEEEWNHPCGTPCCAEELRAKA